MLVHTQVGWSSIQEGLLTDLISFLVSGLPDFVSSGGGLGGAGATIDDAARCDSSTSGSSTRDEGSRRVLPSSK